MVETDLVRAFRKRDRARVTTVLDDLLDRPYGNLVVVGGAAIRYWLLVKTGERLKRPFNDLDFMASYPGDLDPRLTESFLVHHFHLDGPDTDFRFVFVHKATGTKIDVFHWKPEYPDVASVPFTSKRRRNNLLSMQGLSGQFAVTVFDLETMRRRGPVDPKQLVDAELMRPYVNLREANRVWRQLFNDRPPLTVINAFKAAQERAAAQPASFGEKPWQSQDTKYKCAKCVSSADWPIAPMKQIKKLLGYIEIDGANVY